MVHGVMGKVLFIDLSTGQSSVEELPDSFYERYLSGLGLAAKILYERIPAGIDPFSPENILGFVSGVLAGTGSMFGGRFLVVGKSPLTFGWGDANCGGNFAPAIKLSGYDGIFFSGRAKTPMYAHINHGVVSLHSAEGLWGMDAIETEDILQQRHGSRAGVAAIGPAGENLVRFAGISNDDGRMAARSGLGAVMGSKNLKALVLEGKTRTTKANSEEVKKYAKSVSGLMPKGKSKMPAWSVTPLGRLMAGMKTNFRIDGLMSLPPFSEWGTATANELSILTGDSPVRNWRGHPSMFKASNVGIPKIEVTQRKKYHCTACPLGCGSITEMKAEPGKTHRPEYETVTALGANLLNEDIDSIYHLGDTCNRLGLDTISTGSVIGFAFDCYEQGIISNDDTGGIQLKWGDPEVIMKLVKQIAYREGVGDLLAEGVRLAAQKLGPACLPFAFHAGGSELPMHDPRLDPAWGVSYVSDPTPGRHTITNTAEYEMFQLWTRVNWAPEPPRSYPKKKKYQDSEENAMMNAAGTVYKAIMDCAGVCLFGAHLGSSRLGIFDLLNAVTGFKFSPDEYMEIGKRIQDLRQWFNIKHGIQPAEVQINPLVFGDPPVTKGPQKGLHFDIFAMRCSFWQAMGWDEKTGYPLRPAEDL